MGSTAKGLALIPELAALGPSTSTAVAAAAAAVIGQGISHGWGSWTCQVQAREWMDKPYFAQDRLSGTKLETAPDPPHGIKYVKVSTRQLVCNGKEVAANWNFYADLSTCPTQRVDNFTAKAAHILLVQKVSSRICEALQGESCTCEVLRQQMLASFLVFPPCSTVACFGAVYSCSPCLLRSLS